MGGQYVPLGYRVAEKYKIMTLLLTAVIQTLRCFFTADQ